jgi:hypothetical protein
MEIKAFAMLVTSSVVFSPFAGALGTLAHSAGRWRVANNNHNNDLNRHARHGSGDPLLRFGNRFGGSGDGPARRSFSTLPVGLSVSANIPNGERTRSDE